VRQDVKVHNLRDEKLARAVTRYVRIAPRKVRVILGAIRRQSVGSAFSILDNMPKKAARIVNKTLKSAVANAKHKKMDESRLIVRYAFADGGPTLKRFRPRSMGRADSILKRTSHVTVVVEEGIRQFSKPNAPDQGKAGAQKSTKKESKKKLAGTAS